MPKYVIGLDYGTNSVRALVAETQTGEEVAAHVWPYAHGEEGVVLDDAQPDLARQHPKDYVQGLEESVKGALAEAARTPAFKPEDVIGIGVDTTGSTPLPVDAEGEPLAFQDRFANDPAAMAWLWKDHTAHAEAAEITERAESERPAYLAKCGGIYSSEWYWSKLLHAARTAPEVFEAAHTWVELADWVPAILTDTHAPDTLRRCICAAGHKAMFHPTWGYPDEEFLGGLHPGLAQVRRTLPDEAFHIGQPAGALTPEWAERLELPPGIPVAMGAFDAHLGAVGSGIQPGVLVKILGTSSCDIAVAPQDPAFPDIPGLCGIVPESVLPGHLGLEAGQSAVGDIFDWFVRRIAPGGSEHGSHKALTQGADKLAPGESGLLALDWFNGNRTVLVDQRLSGAILGLNLHSTGPEIYRALIESTAMGARVILERFEAYGVHIERVVNCGGISVKNPLVMQIYADILGRPLEISRSSETCALGASMAGAVVAGAAKGGHDTFESAAGAMTGVLDQVFHPEPGAVRIYNRLYTLYKRVHDAFGTREGSSEGMYEVMKELLQIRDEVRAQQEDSP